MYGEPDEFMRYIGSRDGEMYQNESTLYLIFKSILWTSAFYRILFECNLISKYGTDRTYGRITYLSNIEYANPEIFISGSFTIAVTEARDAMFQSSEPCTLYASYKE